MSTEKRIILNDVHLVKRNMGIQCPKCDGGTIEFKCQTCNFHWSPAKYTKPLLFLAAEPSAYLKYQEILQKREISFISDLDVALYCIASAHLIFVFSLRWKEHHQKAHDFAQRFGCKCLDIEAFLSGEEKDV